MIREGFWSASNVPTDAGEWNDRTEFLRLLRNLERKITPVRFRGMSACRICYRSNGSTEFRTDEAEWPEGLKHYIEDHGLRPSKEFIEYVIRCSNGSRVPPTGNDSGPKEA